jgi:hypothetical protein
VSLKNAIFNVSLANARRLWAGNTHLYRFLSRAGFDSKSNVTRGPLQSTALTIIRKTGST